MVVLRYVKEPSHILMSMAVFNMEAPNHLKEARRLVRQTSYWVYRPDKGVFGPGKFVGFEDMDFAKYKAALERDYDGDRFFGHDTMLAIQRTLSQSFVEDLSMWPVLVRWAERLLGAGVLEGVDSSKWRFTAVGPRAAREPLGGAADASRPGADEARYWFTTQYPPVAVAGSGAAVWVFPEYQETAREMKQGDYVAVYETALDSKAGAKGQMAVVVLSKVQKMLAHPVLEIDSDGKKWLKIAKLEAIAEEGKCPSRKVVSILKPGVKLKPGGNMGLFLVGFGGKASPISRLQFERFGNYFKDYVSVWTEAEKKAADVFQDSEDEGQGYVSNSKIRSAVESHAMSVAEKYLEKVGYTQIVNCSKNKPYDFTCVWDGETYFVEVKGTQTDGATVIVTAGEVDFMKDVEDKAMLFVLSSVEVATDEHGEPIASGGNRQVLWPWRITVKALSPITYRYSVPPSKEESCQN